MLGIRARRGRWLLVAGVVGVVGGCGEVMVVSDPAEVEVAIEASAVVAPLNAS